MSDELPKYGNGVRGVFFFNKETGEFCQVEKAPRIRVNAPFVQTDEIPPTLSMTGTDKIHTSKAKLRQEYKELGFVETGGEQARPERFDREKRYRDIRNNVEKVLNDLKYNNVPLSELEKERCKREEREYQEYCRRMRAGTKSKAA